MLNVDGLVQERRISIANALELRLSCTKPLMSLFTWYVKFVVQSAAAFWGGGGRDRTGGNWWRSAVILLWKCAALTASSGEIFQDPRYIVLLWVFSFLEYNREVRWSNSSTKDCQPKASWSNQVPFGLYSGACFTHSFIVSGCPKLSLTPLGFKKALLK